MDSLRQFGALLRTNLADITQRLAPVVTIIIGVGCAVGVLVSMLAMGTGARRQAMGDVREDRVIVMSTGAQSQMQSSISKDVAYSVAALPGIRKGSDGKPIVLFEVLVPFEGRERGSGRRVWLSLFGVSPGLREVVPELRLTGGRWFRPGLRELIASNACDRQFVGFQLGDQRLMRGGAWAMAGHFDQGHSQVQCIVYADLESIISAFGLTSFNTMSALLQSPSTYSPFAQAVRTNPAFRVEAWHEQDVVEQSFKQLNSILNFTAYFVGAIVALGATLGAMNSLYAMVDSRGRELATLRALGFASGPIIASILAESVLLALPGALLGGCLAWAFFDHLSANAFGYTFQLAITPSLVLVGVAWALTMGLVGGLLPALHAARFPVTTGLRAT